MARFYFATALILLMAGPSWAQSSAPRAPEIRGIEESQPLPPPGRQGLSPRETPDNPEAKTLDNKTRQDSRQAGRPDGKAKKPPPLTLPALYEQLAKTTNERDASVITKQIERLWMRSGSDTADLLMTRALSSIAVQDNETALELFDYILILRPDWAEAYHKRATLLFAMSDTDGALRDLQKAITIDPKHYGSMAGLGMMMMSMDDKKAAYAAFKAALEINPHQAFFKSMIEKLKQEVDGQKL